MTAAATPPDDVLRGVLVRLAEAEQKITALKAAQAEAPQDGDEGEEKHQIAPSPRLWEMTPDERREVTKRLRVWVAQVLRPGYGHLAARLGDCWEHHDLCLYLLDWLSQMHGFLYQPGERGWGMLAGQADWHTRFVVAVVAQLQEETQTCDHLPQRGRGAVVTALSAGPR
jgi:hypothetical protein